MRSDLLVTCFLPLVTALWPFTRSGPSKQPATVLKESMMIPLERRGCRIDDSVSPAPLSGTTEWRSSEIKFVSTGGVPMTDFEEAGFIMSLLALAGIAVMADRPLEAACERVLEWFKPR